jgi:Ca2+-binding EF-hand superfamily protein
MKSSYKTITFLGAIIILVALISSSYKPKIHEGYNMMAGTEGAISKSDFYAILTECVSNISSHETILSTLATNYSKSEVKIDQNADDMTNINNLLTIMKKQDKKILEMLPSYLPNKDLDGLIDGSLLKPIADDLKMKSTVPENPMDCDVDTIRRAINGYKKLIADLTGTDDNSKNQKNVYSSMIPMLEMKIVDLNSSKGAPGNAKCLPPLSAADAEGLLDGYYANYISKIIKSQDLAIVSIQNDYKNKLVGFYSATITGKP